MRREDYRKQLEAYKKKEYKSKADALFEVAYLAGMWGTEGYSPTDPIRLEMIGLAAHYACEIDKEILKGKEAQTRLKNLEADLEDQK